MIKLAPLLQRPYSALRKTADQTVVWGVFARSLALTYLISFASLFPQVRGLFGRDGIIPTQELLSQVYAEHGIRSFLIFPTIFWLHADDVMWLLVCVVGVIVSALIVYGLLSRIGFFIVWALYLSMVTVGGDFLYFPWDFLLLEAGFLALFLPSLERLPQWRTKTSLPPLLAFGFLWLLFREMFGMGTAKFWHPVAAWRTLIYTKEYFVTQPLPGPFAWHFYQLPMSAHHVMTASIFLIQIITPFLIFGPRKGKIFAAWVFIIFNLLIEATGNYGIFNVLTIFLCIPLFDERALSLVFRQGKHVATAIPPNNVLRRSSSGVVILLTVLSLFYVCVPFTRDSGPALSNIAWAYNDKVAPRFIPPLLLPIHRTLIAYHALHPWGFFRWPLPSRRIVTIEGSNDQIRWEPYRMKYQMHSLDKQPMKFAPLQPRIDHQIFYESIGFNFYSFHFNPISNAYLIPPHSWFDRLQQRLLEGDDSVENLFAENPFPDAPPHFIRSTIHYYRFSTPEERRKTGAWFIETSFKEHSPKTSLKNM